MLNSGRARRYAGEHSPTGPNPGMPTPALDARQTRVGVSSAVVRPRFLMNSQDLGQGQGRS